MADNPPGTDLNDDVDGPWFSEKKLEWRLDVVTLLAVIGESSMTEHSQAITASALWVPPFGHAQCRVTPGALQSPPIRDSLQKKVNC